MHEKPKGIQMADVRGQMSDVSKETPVSDSFGQFRTSHVKLCQNGTVSPLIKLIAPAVSDRAPIEQKERSDTPILGILAHFRHFRHSYTFHPIKGG
ncbi:MAG: hypothetical protein K9K88_18560 [Desulfobacterales bacterium]|nr:hypothetical protein [Desulfobacterales bacterium]